MVIKSYSVLYNYSYCAFIVHCTCWCYWLPKTRDFQFTLTHLQYTV